ncbi:MAG: hypothetical protein P1U56_18350 [Saprospiraceae bacterium]|nr:hypothetical protein [Saprospiraceae bacterium]
MNSHKDFTFDGHWEFEIILPGLNKLSWDKESEHIDVTICDFLDDEMEPGQEQINAINFLIANQSELVHLITKEIWSQWDEIEDDHEYEQYTEAPKIQSPKDIEKIISVHSIYIDAFHKNGIAYIGIEGDCLWDEEHGIGLVIHKDRVVQFGGAEEANAMGISKVEKPDNEQPKKPEIPKIYSAHPTYNTYKPAHETANFEYPYELIKKGLGDKFIEWIEEGYDVDYVPEKEWNKQSYLVTACTYDNIAAFAYLVGHVTNYDGALEATIKRKNIWFSEILLKKGLKLEEEHFMETVENYFSLLSRNLTKAAMDQNQQKWINFYNSIGVPLTANSTVRDNTTHPSELLEKSKKFIQWFKSKGMSIDESKSSEILSKYSDSSEKNTVLKKEMGWVLQ